mgnify:CR=1 FL=1
MKESFGEAVLPVGRAFFGKGMDQKINKGADLGLGKPAGRIDCVDALGFHWQIGNCVLNQPLRHRIGVKEARQIRDAKTRNRGVQQGLPVVHAQPSSRADLTFLTGRCCQYAG